MQNRTYFVQAPTVRAIIQRCLPVVGVGICVFALSWFGISAPPSALALDKTERPISQLEKRLRQFPSPNLEDPKARNRSSQERSEMIDSSSPINDLKADYEEGIVGIMGWANLAWGALYSPGLHCIPEESIRNRSIYIMGFPDYFDPYSLRLHENFLRYAEIYNRKAFEKYSDTIPGCELEQTTRHNFP